MFVSFRVGRQRQVYPEDTARGAVIENADSSSHSPDHVVDEREPYSVAPRIAIARIFDTVKQVENRLLLLIRNSGTVIGDTQTQCICNFHYFNITFTARRRIFYSVINKVIYGSLQKGVVSSDASIAAGN